MSKNTQSQTLYRTPFSAAYWKSAAKEVKSIRMLTVAALFIALRFVISSFYIPVADNVRVYFTFLINSLGAMIYGPVMALVTGFVGDILGCIIRPTGPFFFGYVLTAMAGSFFYALAFYRTRISIVRIITAKLAVNSIVNVLMGSLWSAMLYHKGYYYYLVKSIIKNVTMLPVEILLMILFFRVMMPITAQLGLTPKQPTENIPFI